MDDIADLEITKNLSPSLKINHLYGIQEHVENLSIRLRVFMGLFDLRKLVIACFRLSSAGPVIGTAGKPHPNSDLFCDNIRSWNSTEKEMCQL